MGGFSKTKSTLRMILFKTQCFPDGEDFPRLTWIGEMDKHIQSLQEEINECEDIDLNMNADWRGFMNKYIVALM